jgi:hypothetical protein
MIVVVALLIGVVLCLILAVPVSKRETPVIGKMTQHGWVQKKGPCVVKRSSRNLHFN